MPEINVNEFEKLQTENSQLKNSIMAYIDESQKLNNEIKELKAELKEREYEIQHKSSLIERLQGMVDAFEICVKARK